jgi:hypothetical protein
MPLSGVVRRPRSLRSALAPETKGCWRLPEAPVPSLCQLPRTGVSSRRGPFINMEYKGYIAAIEYDESVDLLHGRVINAGPAR